MSYQKAKVTSFFCGCLVIVIVIIVGWLAGCELLCRLSTHFVEVVVVVVVASRISSSDLTCLSSSRYLLRYLGR